MLVFIIQSSLCCIHAVVVVVMVVVGTVVVEGIIPAFENYDLLKSSKTSLPAKAQKLRSEIIEAKEKSK